MLRIFWGVMLLVVGALFALQSFGILGANLTFWPVVFTIIGTCLVVRSLISDPFRFRSGRAWIKLSFGLWLTGIGLFDILHANELTTLTGRDVWSTGWFILFIGAGLALIFGIGTNGYRSHAWKEYDRGWIRSVLQDQVGGVGDLHYGREPWVLDRQFDVKHRIGDVRLDLTTAEISEDVHYVKVDAAIGEIVILLPDYCHATVRARVGTGAIHVLGESREGLGVHLQKSVHVPEATATLNIDVRLSVGEISVRHVPVQHREDP